MKFYGYKVPDNPGKTDFRRSYLGQLIGPKIDTLQDKASEGIANIFRRLQFPEPETQAPPANQSQTRPQAPTPTPYTPPSATPRPTATPYVPTPSPSATQPGILPPNFGRPTPTPQGSPGFAGNSAFMEYLQRSVGQSPQKRQIPADLSAAIDAAAKKHGVPRDLLAALSYHESDGWTAQDAYNGDGGVGPYQITLPYHPGVTREQALDPNFASDWAAKNLLEGLAYGGNAENALRYYNAGPYKKKSGKVRSNANRYVDRINKVLREYDFD